MSPEVLQFLGQVGMSGLFFYLLVEERKARNIDVQKARDEAAAASKRYFDFLEKIVIRSFHGKIDPDDI